MNNLLAIKSMHSWVKENRYKPAPEDYVGIYLDNNLEVEVENLSNYNEADSILDYTARDMEDEINNLDSSINHNHSEDCESLEDLAELLDSVLFE